MAYRWTMIEAARRWLGALTAVVALCACNCTGEPTGVTDDDGASAGGGGATTSTGPASSTGPGTTSATGGSEPSEATIRAWAKQVLLGPEFGGAGAITSRWTKSPRISLFSAAADERTEVQAVIAELSPLLAPLSLTLGADEDESADLEVHFVPLAELDGIAAANGFTVVPGNYGYFWMFWDAGHALTKGYVLIAEDQLSGDQRRHFVFEETTQVLGLSNDSATFPDSIFFSSGVDGGSATTLSALDRQLVRFFYMSVPPASNEAALDAAFDTSWPP